MGSALAVRRERTLLCRAALRSDVRGHPARPGLKARESPASFHEAPGWRGHMVSDGKRFLFPVAKEQSAPQPFTVVLNRQAELKK